MGNVVARISARGRRSQGVAMWVLPTIFAGVVMCDIYQSRYRVRVLATDDFDDDDCLQNINSWSLTRHLARVPGLGLQVVGMEPSTSVRVFGRATQEYQKNPDLKREDIAILREWVTTEKHLPPVADEMLIVFHHSCYFDLEDTKRCIENYYTMRTQAPEFFTERDVTSPEFATSLEALNLAPLPLPHPDNGYRIVYHGLQTSDPSKYDFVAAVKLTFMMFDAYVHEHGTAPGFSVIFDMEGTRLRHLFRVDLSALRKYIHYWQDASPVRLKAVHMCNANGLVSKILLLTRPFMKQEFFNLIHVHKPGSDTLYEHIPRQCLPKEFGGSLDSKDVYHDIHMKKLQRLVHFFKAEEKQRVNEELRAKKKKKHC